MLLSIWRGEILAVSAGGKNFVYTGDVAVAAVNALTAGNEGECYIAGNENMSFSQFYELVNMVRGSQRSAVRIPNTLVLLAGAVGSAWGNISGSSPKISYTMSKMSLANQFCSSAKAVTYLAMPQTPVQRAVEKSIAWYREQKYIE
jgi:nucleoside-diphosphate-sugar epimerase